MIQAGDSRTYTADWYLVPTKRRLAVTLTYERHPAAGSRAYPGEAVVGRGEAGDLYFRHAVSDRGQEWSVYAEGPSELDPMSGCSFGLSADGQSLEEALSNFETSLVSIERWAQTKVASATNCAPSKPELMFVGDRQGGVYVCSFCDQEADTPHSWKQCAEVLRERATKTRELVIDAAIHYGEVDESMTRAEIERHLACERALLALRDAIDALPARDGGRIDQA